MSSTSSKDSGNQEERPLKDGGAKVHPLGAERGEDQSTSSMPSNFVASTVAPATPDSSTSSGRSHRFHWAGTVAQPAFVLKKHMHDVDAQHALWAKQGFRKRCHTVWKQLGLCLGDLWVLTWPAVLTAILSAVVMCFVLVEDPGGSLLSGFLLHGRRSVDIDCDEFRNRTACTATNSTGGSVIKTVGMTELGESVDMKALNSANLGMLLGTFGQSVFLSSIYFWHRCPRWYLRRAHLWFVLVAMIMVAIWAETLSDPDHNTVTQTFALVNLGVFTVVMFGLNRLSPPQQKVFKTWLDIVFFAMFNVMILIAIQVFPLVLEALSQRSNSSGVALGVQLFILLMSLSAFQILRRMKSLPPEGSAAQLFLLEFICLNLQRTQVTRLHSLSEVVVVASVSTALNFLRILGSLVYKRWQYKRLVARNKVQERLFLTLLHGTDALTDMAAELLSIVALAPFRIAPDPQLFDIGLGDACDFSGELSNDIAVIGIQIVGTLVAAVLIICASLWMLGPHTYTYVTQTSTGFLLRLGIANQVFMTISASIKLSLRKPCIFCELQAEGETCH